MRITGSSPNTVRATTDASTDATTTGANEAAPKAPSIFSDAKSTPAIGALKAAAMPAAEPAPTNVLSRSGEARNHRPMRELVAAPATTTGPSGPTELPVPMSSADATVFAATGPNRIRPERDAMACMTSAMFSPSEPRAPQRTSARLAIRPRATIPGMTSAMLSGAWATP
jgi:hypothetical protein